MLRKFFVLLELSNEGRGPPQRREDSPHEQRVQRARVTAHLRPLHREGGGGGARLLRGRRQLAPGPQRGDCCI